MNYFYDYWPEVSAFIKKYFYFLCICFQLLIFGSFNSKVQALITKLAYLWIFLLPLSLCHYHSLLVTFCNYEHYSPLQKSNHIYPVQIPCVLTNNDVFLFTFSCIILVLMHIKYSFLKN